MRTEPRPDAPEALYHVSDLGGIERFDPRPAPNAVVASTLQFSIIRWRNAQPRSE